MKQAQACPSAQQRRALGRKPYLVFQGGLLDRAHPVASVLLTQPADEADRLPVVLTEEQLDLLHVTLTLRQGLGAQAGYLSNGAAAGILHTGATIRVSFLGTAKGTHSLVLRPPWGHGSGKISLVTNRRCYKGVLQSTAEREPIPGTSAVDSGCSQVFSSPAKDTLESVFLNAPHSKITEGTQQMTHWRVLGAFLQSWHSCVAWHSDCFPSPPAACQGMGFSWKESRSWPLACSAHPGLRSPSDLSILRFFQPGGLNAYQTHGPPSSQLSSPWAELQSSGANGTGMGGSKYSPSRFALPCLRRQVKPEGYCQETSPGVAHDAVPWSSTSSKTKASKHHAWEHYPDLFFPRDNMINLDPTQLLQRIQLLLLFLMAPRASGLEQKGDCCGQSRPRIKGKCPRRAPTGWAALESRDSPAHHLRWGAVGPARGRGSPGRRDAPLGRLPTAAAWVRRAAPRLPYELATTRTTSPRGPGSTRNQSEDERAGPLGPVSQRTLGRGAVVGLAVPTAYSCFSPERPRGRSGGEGVTAGIPGTAPGSGVGGCPGGPGFTGVGAPGLC
ncbi:hypothetical protein HPG69_011910 [Diceros bicornis minor]|uniref:Uncharacterized protein n=1 Tax=Diceros bicornis minor TaxID=77932 RepID=A0A7J7ES27_DICBM|nr:hypothetical protein HPG69_011910 [Diceros bicornis minor]